MQVNTSKCCAANTADLWSIDLQSLEHSNPIITLQKGALVRSFCGSVYWLLKEHLLAPVIFLVKASFRNLLVRLVTRTTLIRILSFVGCHHPTGGHFFRLTKQSGHCWWVLERRITVIILGLPEPLKTNQQSTVSLNKGQCVTSQLVICRDLLCMCMPFA